MACVAGDFCFVCKAGMGVGIAASFRILVAAVVLPLAWSLNASPESGQLAGMSYHLLALNLTALMLGTSAAFCLGVLLFFPYLWLWGDWHNVTPSMPYPYCFAFVR